MTLDQRRGHHVSSTGMTQAIMSSRTLAGWVSVGIGLVSALRVAQVWDQLPERMASHFGPSGQPDAFMTRGGFFLFYFAIFGTVIGLLLAMPRVLSRMPREIVNVPHRDYWLTDERWPEAIDRMSQWLSWFAVALTALAAVVLQLVLRSNLLRMPLETTPMLATVGVFFAFTMYWLVALHRAFTPPN